MTKSTGTKKTSARSAAGKKAAATRKARDEEAQAERERYKIWEERFKSGAIFLFGVLLALNEFLIEAKLRELGVIFAGAAMSLPLALPGMRK